MRKMGCALFAAMVFLFTPWLATATEFTWKDAAGKSYNLAEFRKPVALHFWATWCTPCRSELPELATWRNEHQDVNVVTISLDRNMSTVADFLMEERVDIPALIARSSEAMRFGVRGLPATVIVGPDGKVRKLYNGPVPWNEEAFTEQFLALMKP